MSDAVPDPSTSVTVSNKKPSWFRRLLKKAAWVILIYVCIRILIFPFLAFYIVPTGAMENEIMSGDWILVRKSAQHERGRIVVFLFPGMRDEVIPREEAFYMKRCIAIEGDTLKIVDRRVFINGEPEVTPRNMKFNSSAIKQAGYADPRIFPNGASFNEDNYGPIRIPKKGDVISLNRDNFYAWGVFIKREGHNIDMREGSISVDGKEVERYTVERDYLFVMGDNRDNSLDSRFYGFIPAETISATPLIVYGSSNPDIPYYYFFDMIGSMRWNRIGVVLK